MPLYPPVIPWTPFSHSASLSGPDPQSTSPHTSFWSHSLHCPGLWVPKNQVTSAVYGIECSATNFVQCRTTEGVVRLLVERLVDQKKLVSARQAMCRISVSTRYT